MLVEGGKEGIRVEPFGRLPSPGARVYIKKVRTPHGDEAFLAVPGLGSSADKVTALKTISETSPRGLLEMVHPGANLTMPLNAT